MTGRTRQLLFLLLSTLSSVDAFRVGAPHTTTSRTRTLLHSESTDVVVTARQSNGHFRKTAPSTSLLQRLTSPLTTSTMALPMFLVSVTPLITMFGNPAAAADASSLHQPAASLSPTVEAELLTDVSHVVLDLFTFFGPGHVAMRLAAIVGRVLAVTADYVPDHRVVPEELVFQVFMLGVAWVGLVKAALPLAFASMGAQLTYRDGKAYHCLLEPVGVTRQQFRALSTFCTDWVQVEAGRDIVTDDAAEAKNQDYLYWLYAGSAVVSRNGKVLYEVTGGHQNKSEAALGLLGESRLLQKELKRKDYKNGTTAVAGDQGATLLRIHKDHLQLLMQSDAGLEESMRELLFSSMHDKLAAQMPED